MLLRSAKPDLYEEFRRDYTQMGEKSFDHTKKYWFNRLRKEFLLEVIEVPKEVPASVPTATGGKGIVSGNTGAKPTGLSSTRPAGFKPRFKPGITASAKSTEDPMTHGGDTQSNPQSAAEPTSPAKSIGFKPRFKAGVTPVKKSDIDEEPNPDAPKPTTESSMETRSKPLGFKPRFKAGKTTGKKDDTDT